MEFTRLTLLSKDKSKQIINLPSTFGTEIRKGVSVKVSVMDQVQLAKDIGHDILQGNYLNAVLD